MFTTPQIKKVNVFFPRENKEEFLNGLQSLACAHIKNVDIVDREEVLGEIEDYKYTENISIPSLYARSKRLIGIYNDVLRNEDILESLLGPRDVKKISVNSLKAKKTLINSERVIHNLEMRTDKYNEFLENAKKEEGKIKNEIDELRYLKEFDIDPQSLGGFDDVFFFCGLAKTKKIRDIRNELYSYECLYIKEKFVRSVKVLPVFIIGMKKDEKKIRDFLDSAGFRFLDCSGYRHSYMTEYNKRKELLLNIKRKKEYEKNKIKEFMTDNHERLLVTNSVLETFSGRNKARSLFKGTECIVAAEFYARTDDVEKIRESITKSTKGIFFMESSDAKDPPVILSDNRFFRGFEILTKGYGLPGKEEMDPTAFMGLFFPVFFGFMIGDIGYGILIMISSLLLRHFFRNDTAAAFSSILFLGAISSFVFGFLFGGFFGSMIKVSPLWFDPSKNPVYLISLSVGAGIIHITIGIIISAVQNIRKRRMPVGELSWLMIESGGVLSTLAFFGIMADVIYYPAALLLATGLAVKIKNPVESIGIMSFAGNILSYIRLSAISLTTVYIAFLVNMFTGMANGISFLAGFIVFITGHIFNCILSTTGSMINSVRLHYVEFFSRFYGAEGREFEAFMYGRAIIEE